MEPPILPPGRIVPEYSRQARRRRWLRWVAVGGACAGIVVAAYFSPWPRKFWIEWVQHLCMNYQLPADEIAFESCPPANNTISGQLLVGDRAANPGTAEHEKSAWCWREYSNICADRWFDPPDNPRWPDREPGIVFLHALKTLSGNTQLVHVAVWYRQGGAVQLQCEMFDPDDAMKAGTIFYSGDEVALDFGVSPSTPIVLYAGQPDPADPTKFAFDYIAGSLKGQIIGEFIKRDVNGGGQLFDCIQFRWGKGGPLVKED
jgi:hypothetical protein